MKLLLKLSQNGQEGNHGNKGNAVKCGAELASGGQFCCVLAGFLLPVSSKYCKAGGEKATF